MTSTQNLGNDGSLLSQRPLISDANADTISEHIRAVDVHMHFIPDFYRHALASANMASPDGINALPSWNEEHFLLVMDSLRIETAMLSDSIDQLVDLPDRMVGPNSKKEHHNGS